MKRVWLVPLLALLASGEAGAQKPARVPAPVRWEGAEAVKLARPSKKCSAERIGDWMRLHCEAAFGFYLLGGDGEGVDLKTAKPEPGSYAILPLKEGDRRVLVITSEFGTSGYTIEEDVVAVISEVWMPGEPGPTISVD